MVFLILLINFLSLFSAFAALLVLLFIFFRYKHLAVLYLFCAILAFSINYGAGIIGAFSQIPSNSVDFEILMRFPQNPYLFFFLRSMSTLAVMLFFPLAAGNGELGIALTGNIFHQSLNIPFISDYFLEPENCGINVGIEWIYINTESFNLFQSAVVEISNYYLFVNTSLFTEMGIRFLFPFDINYEFLIGAGYMHTFRKEVAIFKDGNYEYGIDPGVPSIPALIRTGFSYVFKTDNNPVFDFGLYYRLSMQMIPWEGYEPAVPVLPYSAFLLSTRIYL